MSILARFLLLCSLLSIFLSEIATQPAQAKLGPISITSVYTTDKDHNNKIVFRPGDPINFHVDVNNTTSGTFPIDVQFQAFANDYSPDTALYHYGQTEHLDQMPVGLSRFYTPVTIPSDAKSYFYAVRITITPTGCQGTGCQNDGDLGESTFTIQNQLYSTKDDRGQIMKGFTTPPAGLAENLIVLVHGCCTDEYGVAEWVTLQKVIKASAGDAWEVVVWNWHEYTPRFDATLDGFRYGGDTAYQNATHQGAVLASAIALFADKYKYVHFIAHSAGAKLIHEAAKSYIGNYSIRQRKPFIYLTFLDAYTPNNAEQSGTGGYGSLPVDYPDHYSEQYVNRGDWPFTDACLANAFSFDITGWLKNEKACAPTDLTCAHGWPVVWYNKSVTSAPPTRFLYGYPLSFEGGNSNYATLSKTRTIGQQCGLSSLGSFCTPMTCW